MDSMLQIQSDSMAQELSIGGQEDASTTTRPSQCASSVPNPDIRSEPCKNLLELPPEIIQYIATFLPVSSVAVFTLTSRSTMKTLGTDSFKRLEPPNKNNNRLFELVVLSKTELQTYSPPAFRFWGPAFIDERMNFLRLLDRDIPDMVICFSCKMFHDLSVTNAKTCTKLDCNHERQAEARLEGTRELKFYWAQLLIKRHNFGLDTYEILSRLAAAHNNGWCKRKLNARSEARVISLANGTDAVPGKRLYFRSQYFYRLPKEQVPLKAWRFDFCDHEFSKAIGQKTLEDHVRSVVDRHYESSLLSPKPELGRQSSKRTKRCTLCATEYEIEVIDSQLSITIYQDFGTGRSPTESLWQDHFEPNFRRSLTKSKGETEQFGLLKARFEGATRKRKSAPQ